MSRKMLIVYYSVSNGNTRRVAEMLRDATGADLMEIQTVVPYTGSYDAIVSQGQREVEQGVQPELKPLQYDIADYDVIAIGTPTWWYTMASAVLSYVSEQNWSGKTVVPFMTDGGWPGHVMKDIRKICKGADVKLEMEVRFDSTGGSNMETPEETVQKWTKEVAKLL